MPNRSNAWDRIKFRVPILGIGISVFDVAAFNCSRFIMDFTLSFLLSISASSLICRVV
jgi:hypothetical protein